MAGATYSGGNSNCGNHCEVREGINQADFEVWEVMLADELTTILLSDYIAKESKGLFMILTVTVVEHFRGLQSSPTSANAGKECFKGRFAVISADLGQSIW
jgi:hypothetical protein